MHVSIIVIAGEREKKSKFFVNSDKQRVMYHFNDWTSSLLLRSPLNNAITSYSPQAEERKKSVCRKEENYAAAHSGLS